VPYSSSADVLSLVRKALDEFDDRPLDATVRRVARIAVLLGETELAVRLGLELKPSGGLPAANQEKAMVARLDGDEFGVLVENTATTPDIATIAAAVNRELAEPLYVDGHGLALSASIGVVRGGRDDDLVELLRAADQALRRARTKRRGQWEVFDPDRDIPERSTQELAVGMPGAWERGEITVRYRPVVRLVVGIPARVATVAEAADNLAVLDEMGVRTALEDFALGLDDFAAAGPRRARDPGGRALCRSRDHGERRLCERSDSGPAGHGRGRLRLRRHHGGSGGLVAGGRRGLGHRPVLRA
jgi:hypothetical protein